MAFSLSLFLSPSLSLSLLSFSLSAYSTSLLSFILFPPLRTHVAHCCYCWRFCCVCYLSSSLIYFPVLLFVFSGSFPMLLLLVARLTTTCHINVITVYIKQRLPQFFRSSWPAAMTCTLRTCAVFLRRIFLTAASHCLSPTEKRSQRTLLALNIARLFLFSYHAPYSPGFLTGSRARSRFSSRSCSSSCSPCPTSTHAL